MPPPVTTPGVFKGRSALRRGGNVRHGDSLAAKRTFRNGHVSLKPHALSWGCSESETQVERSCKSETSTFLEPRAFVARALPRNKSGAGSSAAIERPLEIRKHHFTWNSVSILPKKACIYKDRDNSLFAFQGLFPGLGKNNGKKRFCSISRQTQERKR